MGEPAFQLPEEDKPDIRPRLNALEGGGESTPRKSGHLSSVGEEGSAADSEKNGLFNKDGDNKDSAYGPSALDDIKSKLGGGSQEGSGKSRKNPLSRMLGGKSKIKKRIALAAAAGAATAIGGVFVFLAMLPLKIESIVSNLESRFAANTEQAIGTESDRLLSRWVAKQIMPNLLKGSCHTVVDASCVKTAPGDGPVSKLFNGWKQGRIEEKLAANHSLVISRDSNKIYISTPQVNASISPKDAEAFTNAKDPDLAKLMSDHNTNKRRVSRTELRQALRDSLKKGTLWDRSYGRFVYGRYLEKKFGVKRCVIACDQRDTFTDKIQDKKLLAKAVIVQRVITPLNTNYGFILSCVLLGDNSECSTDGKNAKATPDNQERETNGEKKLKSNLAKNAALVGEDKLPALVKKSSALGEKGLTAYFAGQLARTFVNRFIEGASAEAAGKIAEGSIPIVGWVAVVAQIAHTAAAIGPTVKYLSYAANAAAAVQLYNIYLSSSSEMKSNHVDPTELGSLADSLSGNLTGAKDDRSDATQTPLYNAYNPSASNGTQIAAISGGKVSADSSTSTNTYAYTCNNGKPVPKDKVVCDEEKLDRGNNIANAITTAFDIPVLKQSIDAISYIANVIPWLISLLFNIFPSGTGEAICNVTPLCPQAEQAAKVIGPKIANVIINVLIDSPFSKNMSGGRTYDMMAAGADVSHNLACQTTAGCGKISDSTALKVQNDHIAEQVNTFRQRPFFARMFSTDTPYSLVSRMAVSMPGSKTALGSHLASVLAQDPLVSISRFFGTMFSGRQVLAASGPMSDPFGVVQTGYSDADIPANPQAFWDKNCLTGPLGKYDGTSLDVSDWLNNEGYTLVDGTPNTEIDANTGQQVNLKTNPCQLIMATVISAGATSDASLIPDDAKNSDGGSDNGSGGAAGFRVATYNTLRDNDGPHNSEICGHSGLPDGHACYVRRTQLQADIITGKSSVTTKPFDLFGVNETTNTMYGLLKADLPDYNSVRSDSLAIFWRKDTFPQKLDSGTSPQIGPVTKILQAPWVELATASGRHIFYMPLHYASYFGGTEATATASAEKTVAWAKTKASPDSIVIVGGDISTHVVGPTRVFNGSGILKNTGNLAKHNSAKPPGSDQIYLTPISGLTVTSWTRPAETPGTIIVKASDHAPVFADVSVAGDSAAVAGTPGKDFVGNDGFGGGWCTDYINYILGRHSSKYHGGSLGDGKDVATSLGKLGYKVDHTPAIHAVVSFPGPPYGNVGSRYAGHVALVAQINKDGSIVVEESNFNNPMKYGTHSVSAKEAKTLTYAHTDVGWH